MSKNLRLKSVVLLVVLVVSSAIGVYPIVAPHVGIARPRGCSRNDSSSVSICEVAFTSCWAFKYHPTRRRRNGERSLAKCSKRLSTASTNSASRSR